MPPDAQTPPVKSADVVGRYASATVDDLVANHAQDVSKGGMLVRTTSGGSPAPGTLVDFEIRLADDQVVITGAGRVMWKREAPDGERPAGIALKFIDLDDASQGVIDRLLAARKAPLSEFERPPAPPGSASAKTVMGIGSAFGGAAPPRPGATPSPSATGPRADESRGGTRLGVAPVKLTPEEAARVATRLGLAPAAKPAGLQLGEQSSPAVPVKPPPGAPGAQGAPAPPRPASTSDIDAAWLEELKTGKRGTVPAEGGAPAAPVQLKTAKLEVVKPSEAETPLAPPVEETPVLPPAAGDRTTPIGGSDEQEAPGAVFEEPSEARRIPSDRPSAAADLDFPAGVPRRSAWPWMVLFLLAAVGGVYRFRGPLHRAGLIPTFPALPFLSSAPAPAPLPAAQSATVASAAASASAVPSASASAAPSAAPSAAASEDTAAAAASASAGVHLDAGKATVKAAPSASAAPVHAPPSASASAKPHKPPTPPKPKTPSDDSPY